MKKISISSTRDYFVVNEKPFFYLADTVWNAFSTTALEEWEEYLHFRKTQNFNALQISVLPVLHDASDTYLGLYPFHTNDEGNWDFHRINDAFFDKAEQMLEMACRKGFIPALVVLWNNYVPGTWANARRTDCTMPFEAVKPYTEYVVKRFSKFNPLYFISGDTAFENEEIIKYFMTSLSTVKELAPDALTALHIVGNYHKLPEPFIHSNHLDVYIYQSGHNWEDQHMTYRLAQHFMEKPVKRPILNSEPCYEGHGHGNRYGRFNAFDVRKAFWSSVLSGAKAGFTYGAHGVWSWHRRGASFTSEAWSKMPFDWHSALRMQGAWEASFAKSLFETYDLFDIRPGNHHLLTEFDDIRAGVSSDLNKIAIYVPASHDVLVDLDLSAYDVVMIELSERNMLNPAVETGEQGSTIKMCDFNTDVLIMCTKRG